MIHTIREYPNATKEFLRFQVGYMETRILREPIYNGRRVIGECDSYRGERVPVFRLLGFGETIEQAAAMAAVKEKRTGNKNEPVVEFIK